MISEKTKTPSPRKKKHCLLVPKKTLHFQMIDEKNHPVKVYSSNCQLLLKIYPKRSRANKKSRSHQLFGPTFWKGFSMVGMLPSIVSTVAPEKKKNGSFRKDRLGPLGEVGRAELEELKVVRFVVFLERTHKRKTYPRWKFNMAPENKPSQKESHLQTIIF